MAKRKQVKNACINCQRACKKCDDLRPCTRCVRYGFEGSCVNSRRKERTKRSSRTHPSSCVDGHVLNNQIIYPEVTPFKALAYVCSALVMKEEQASKMLVDAAMAALRTRQLQQQQQQEQEQEQHIPLQQNSIEEEELVTSHRATFSSSPIPRTSGILTPPATPSDLKLNHCIEFHHSPGLPTVAAVVRSSAQEQRY